MSTMYNCNCAWYNGSLRCQSEPWCFSLGSCSSNLNMEKLDLKQLHVLQDRRSVLTSEISFCRMCFCINECFWCSLITFCEFSFVITVSFFCRWPVPSKLLVSPLEERHPGSNLLLRSTICYIIYMCPSVYAPYTSAVSLQCSFDMPNVNGTGCP